MSTARAEQPPCSDLSRRGDRHGARRPSPVDRQIGVTLRRLRSICGLTQQQMANRCGLSTQQIQKYETGTNRIPASRLFAIAGILGMKPTDLLAAAWSGDPPEDICDSLQKRLNRAAGSLDPAALSSLVDIAEQLARR